MNTRDGQVSNQQDPLASRRHEGDFNIAYHEGICAFSLVISFELLSQEAVKPLFHQWVKKAWSDRLEWTCPAFNWFGLISFLGTNILEIIQRYEWSVPSGVSGVSLVYYQKYSYRWIQWNFNLIRVVPGNRGGCDNIFLSPVISLIIWHWLGWFTTFRPHQQHRHPRPYPGFSIRWINNI